MAGGFALRSFIRSVLSGSDSPDPKTLAKEVFRRLQLEPALQRAALEQALPYVCQTIMKSSKPSLAALGGSSVGAESADRPASGRAPRTESWKNRGFAEHWEEKLEHRYGIGPNDWPKFGDCGIAELTKKAQYHDYLTASNRAEAVAAREWIHLLRTHGVPTIRQLPKIVLRRHLAGSKAA